MFMLLSLSIHSTSGLSLAITSLVLTSVSCYYVTSFNNGSKKTRDVGLTCGCRLGDVLADSVFYDSKGWGMTHFFKRL